MNIKTFILVPSHLRKIYDGWTHLRADNLCGLVWTVCRCGGHHYVSPSDSSLHDVPDGGELGDGDEL
jgi:hypothetical protein